MFSTKIIKCMSSFVETCLIYRNVEFKTIIFPKSREISYTKYVTGRRTRLVTFCVGTAFYNGLLKER